MPIRVLLADDHTLMRQGLRHILESNPEIDVVAEASSGIEAVEAARQHSPDIAIVDVAMKELNGIEATSEILKQSPETSFFSPAVAALFHSGFTGRKDPREWNDRFDLLTSRERQIYQLLAEGNRNKDIANRLNLSLHTVETHRWHIMEKLDLHSTAELVLSAVRRGMVS